MTKFKDLDDDCLLSVLNQLSFDELFKLRKVNRQLNRVAVVTLRNKIIAISFLKRYEKYNITDCQHLGDINRSKVVLRFTDEFCKFLNSWNDDKNQSRNSVSKLFSMLTNVKRIEFGEQVLIGDFILELIRNCRQLECVNLKKWLIDKAEWSRICELSAPNLVHVVNDRSTERLKYLTLVVEKCINIQRINWIVEDSDKEFKNLVLAFKKLPKNCLITFKCGNLKVKKYEDIFDKLEVGYKFNWSMFSHRCEQLRQLDIRWIHGPVRGVKFVCLKKLSFTYDSYNNSIDYLISSRLPCLEELRFNYRWCTMITDDEYDALFRNMSQLKKLTIVYYFSDNQSLPGPATIQRLKNLETIKLKYEWRFDDDVDGGRHRNWKPYDEFLKPIELFAREIKSPGKVMIDVQNCQFRQVIKSEIVEEIKKMNIIMKQLNGIVEIELVL